MGRQLHKHTQSIIEHVVLFAQTEAGRKLYPSITDDNRRAHTILQSYKGNYVELVELIPILGDDYNEDKSHYGGKVDTALKRLKEKADRSDPPSTPVRSTRRNAPAPAPATAPPAAPSTPAHATSADLSEILVQTVSTLGKTFAERDEKTNEQLMQLRREAADRDEKYTSSLINIDGKADRAIQMAKDTKKFAVEQCESVRKEMNDRMKKYEDDKAKRQLFADGKYNCLICSHTYQQNN
jgi:hypothetical protein